MPKFIS